MTPEKGDTKTDTALRVAAEGSRSDIPADRCCNTKTQNLILDVAERIINVEDEVEELKNNPDVVDIVDTYADLQSYDTSTLTDKDIIRVLADETHSGNSTYYRWDSTDQEFDFIGEISGGGGEFSKEITEADFNYPVNNPTDVALWLLDPGVYHVRKSSTFVVRADASDSSVGIDIDVLVFPRLTTGTNTELTPLVYKNTSADEWQFDYVYTATGNSGLKTKFIMGKGISNNLSVSTSGYVLDARQGKALNDKITPTTGSGAPTTSTTGIVGKIYIDTATNTAYMCVSDTGGTYTWKQITA